MLNKRTSYVNHITIDSLATTSTFEIGDSTAIHAFSRAIAIQREQELFFSNEANFDDFEIFKREIPLDPITEELTYESSPINSFIKVNRIDIIGVSTSSILHIGSSNNVFLEARVKHIRQLNGRK
ncbi:spore germination protein GerPE [Bacillus dakarensis]|uniref:spore germination protein GerPE n=1 Tax=Robertmurraya dakarensis TaxID=1926278 RepID=UPI000981492B|nr:spore germination protein GerPE [Bacillus dakarensis]